jgi:hypothetical protein
VRSTRFLNHLLEYQRSEQPETAADRDVTDLAVADDLTISHRFPKPRDLSCKFREICSNLLTTLTKLRHTDKSRFASYVTYSESNYIHAQKCSSGCTWLDTERAALPSNCSTEKRHTSSVEQG